ncbi:hypothetical protein AB6G16_10580 [Proteus mirabilis]
MAIVQFYTTRRKDENPSKITNNLRYELPDDHNFSADDDLDSCIEVCAEYYHADCDGWEISGHCYSCCGLMTNILARLKLSVILTQCFQQIRSSNER